ncbi:unnamed protein product [Auanema sp. JU1783]|nr:unnamed protein product [Auanema sp. JU1783]
MPKKFANENPKVTAARDRKETAKKTEQDRKQKAVEDAYWEDNDKLANRKIQRKDDEEKKKAEALKRKEENRRLAEEESKAVGGKVASSTSKVTRADIEKQREAALLQRLQEDRLKKLEATKIEVTPEHKLEENINKLSLTEESARNVDEALQVLGAPGDEVDMHPEKRMKSAYLTFEETRLPQLKQEHPTYRLSQLKQLLKKEWQKSPDNPLNRVLAMTK